MSLAGKDDNRWAVYAVLGVVSEHGPLPTAAVVDQSPEPPVDTLEILDGLRQLGRVRETDAGWAV